ASRPRASPPSPAGGYGPRSATGSPPRLMPGASPPSAAPTRAMAASEPSTSSFAAAAEGYQIETIAGVVSPRVSVRPAARSWGEGDARFAMTNSVHTISNGLLSVLAGLSSFVFTLLAFMLLTRLDSQLAAFVLLGLFALLIVWVAAEPPNSGQARAVGDLIERLMAGRCCRLVPPPTAA